MRLPLAMFWIAAVLGVLAILGLWLGGYLAVRETTAPTPPLSNLKAGPEVQKERREAIDRFVGLGAISKIEPTDPPQLWVDQGFYEAKFEDKETIAGVVFAWIFQLQRGWALGSPEVRPLVLYLIDSRTGKEVGKYGASTLGLKMN